LVTVTRAGHTCRRDFRKADDYICSFCSAAIVQAPRDHCGMPPLQFLAAPLLAADSMRLCCFVFVASGVAELACAACDTDHSPQMLVFRKTVQFSENAP
jgi:hypothetical protein